MGFIAIKITRSWSPGSWNLIRTKFEKDIPDKISEYARRFIETRIGTYVPRITGKLANSIRVSREGRYIHVESDMDYLRYAEEGFRSHAIPTDWWGNQSFEARWIDDPEGFITVSSPGAKFFKRTIQDLRYEIKDMMSSIVNDEVKEAFS